jgi:ribonuclease HI
VADLAEFHARLAELRAQLGPPTQPGAYQANTDGACLGNPDGPGGWAAVVEQVGPLGPLGSSGATWELWGHLSSTSNNRAEALGVLAAIEWVPPGSALRIRSDSELTTRILQGAYRARANLDVWTEIRRAIAERGLQVQTEWVRGHAGDLGNERADALSVLGAVQGDAERWERQRASAPPRGRAARQPDTPLPARAARRDTPGRQRAARHDTPLPPRAARQDTAVPPELVGLQPQGAWETSFLSSVARQLRAGRALSDKQRAIVERIRARGA